ncbi:MAG: ATP-dependent Clp protease ATP-binding subunit ClpA, partial [Zetaproteobacteria bacterium]|nr:ATP-dependent Clp protease ATP-binding subunit ClpA [Pseudobdellovibrionaceae bacterium]
MLSPELEVTLNLAISEAKRRGHEYVTVEHILYALMHDPSSSDAIIQCGGDVEEVKLDIEEFFDDQLAKVNLAKSKIPQPTLGFQRVIQRAAHHVSASGNEAIMGSHVLVSIFSEEESFAAYFLSRQQISRLDVIQQFSYSFDSDEDQSLVQTDYAEVESDEDDEDDEKKSTSASKRDPLNQFAVNLCARAKEGKIDPLIGRETEVERAMQILCRRRKNNPLFVGDAGTGKTAIAEGLALRIVENKVPPLLQGAEIFALDIGALLAGSKFRGDFEQRLKGVLKSLKNHEKGILFIDEIHTLIGAGSVGGGAMDASNLLKPSLASGELRCMGSTTFKEFRNSIEGDHALYRRFQKIDVAEPTVAETIKILKGLKSRYEDYHKVTYSAGAIRAAAELSARYITDKKLPDKAIDVIDEVAAALNLKGDKIKKRKISHEMVQSVVAKMARIPPQKVSSGDKQYLKTLELDLKQKIFGQDRAIEALATAIKMSRSGLTEEDKPIGSFLFTGPTGVGKTELSRQLAKQMGIELLRFDMSEYMEKHSVSRLIGAPPGYVGFDQGGQLTDAVNKNPHVVLLLDEIEKA